MASQIRVKFGTGVGAGMGGSRANGTSTEEGLWGSRGGAEAPTRIERMTAAPLARAEHACCAGGGYAVMLVLPPWRTAEGEVPVSHPGYCFRRTPQNKVCVPKFDLQFPGPLIDFIFVLRYTFLVWVRGGASAAACQGPKQPPAPEGSQSTACVFFPSSFFTSVAKGWI